MTIPPSSRSGIGAAINSSPLSASDRHTAIHRIQVVKGAGIAQVWTDAICTDFLQQVVGIGRGPVFARASCASHRGADGTYYLASHHLPRCGDAGALRLESEQTNKARSTVDPAAAAIWTASGAPAAAVINDLAALRAAGLEAFSVDGPVYRYNNNSGATRYIYDSNAACRTGNVNRHSLSIFAKYAAGANAELGWWDISAGAFTSAGVILGAYARTEWPNLVPPLLRSIV